MDLTNLIFLYLFLPLSLLIYHLMREVWQKNLALIAISLTFYAFGQPVYVLVMVALCIVNHKFALRIDPEEKRTVILPVLINVGILAVFKYLSVVLDLFDVATRGFQILPVGLSVFAFSAISYLLDVYNCSVEPEEDFGKLLLYFMMFPKLLQGPIVPYGQIRSQMVHRNTNARSVFEGFQRFLFGLSKKVLLADACGRILNVLNESGGDNTLVGVWFAAILFMLQVYYDFSGYCDMAIGLGRMFGFRYCENFNRPYMALSVTDFCKRWNITLVAFFRNYVYETLGAGEWGKSRKVINMLICFVLAGLWHSTGLNYLIWVVYLWAILTVELFLHEYMRFWPDSLCRAWTLWLLAFGFILFSHENLGELKSALAAILGYGGFGVTGLGSAIVKSFPLLFTCILGCTNFPVYVKRIFAGVCGMDRRSSRVDNPAWLRIAYTAVCLSVVLFLLWICTVAMVTNPQLPSIYGRF